MREDLRHGPLRACDAFRADRRLPLGWGDHLDQLGHRVNGPFEGGEDMVAGHSKAKRLSQANGAAESVECAAHT